MKGVLSGSLRELKLGSAFVIVAIGLLLLFTGCRTFSTADVKLIETSAAVNLTNAEDAALPQVARSIALHNYDAWMVLRYSATGEEPPADVVERLERED